jgi:hypothetical protein
MSLIGDNPQNALRQRRCYRRHDGGWHDGVQSPMPELYGAGHVLQRKAPVPEKGHQIMRRARSTFCERFAHVVMREFAVFRRRHDREIGLWEASHGAIEYAVRKPSI